MQIMITADEDFPPGWSPAEVARRVQAFLSDGTDDCHGHGIIEHLHPVVSAMDERVPA